MENPNISTADVDKAKDVDIDIADPNGAEDLDTSTTGANRVKNPDKGKASIEKNPHRPLADKKKVVKHLATEASLNSFCKFWFFFSLYWN